MRLAYDEFCDLDESAQFRQRRSRIAFVAVVEHMIGWQRRGHVCVAVFDPPEAGEQARRWRDEHAEEYGPLDDWIMNFGRAAAGGDWASIWVPREHLPPGFPVSDKRLG